MRKHSVRKWLHALLDLLPLVVIPVFMVYSHRHQIDSYTVERTEYTTIHMQQNVINGLPNNTNYWYEINDLDIVFMSNNNNPRLLVYLEENEADVYGAINQNINTNDVYLFKISSYCADLDVNAKISCYLTDDNDSYEIVKQINISTLQNIQFRFTYNGTLTNDIKVNLYFETTDATDVYFSKVQLFNLTQMFGSGNEPTIDEFNALFPDDYYDVNSNAVAYVPYTRTYNDTDIGSQIFYSLYNSVDKYFNCNKLFSFSGVYDWINFNLFGGNAPLMVDVVYQIIVYEFFMDLIFLIYSVFMFIIDFASNFLEYCFSWSHRGGR